MGVDLVLEATPTTNTLAPCTVEFRNLAQALDYAAQGVTGFNFYTGRGDLYASLPYSRLRDQAQKLAHRLLSLGLERGGRVALVAETTPDFLRFFFACQYIGLIPIPLPIPVSLGGAKAYVAQLRAMLISSESSVVMAPSEYLPFLEEATEGLTLSFWGNPNAFDKLPESSVELRPSESSELAYLQYTSGSTRFPQGVMITQETVLNNLAGIIKHGVKIGPGDRCVSWLPFYHDMGLIGLVLAPVTSQVSVDYLGTREFAMRPRQWLALISKSRATISFSPPFGYELCERRLRPEEAAKFDLSAWRVAGVGAEMIRPELLTRFSSALAPSGFNEKAFLACYGMAECTLGVSFTPLSKGLKIDRVDADYLTRHGKARPPSNTINIGQKGVMRINSYVNCGRALPGFEVEIRDEQGRPLPDRNSGTIFLRGGSVMSGYFGDPEVTQQVLSEDGWLNTGDMGYQIDGTIVVTGRKKDLIIINGRNIWPQDIEYLVEQQPEVRAGDALAFSVPGPNAEDVTVMVVQYRGDDAAKRADLTSRLRQLVRSELGIECFVELAPLHTLPRTSSGKLSRSKARQNFLKVHGHAWYEAYFTGVGKQQPYKQAI